MIGAAVSDSLLRFYKPFVPLERIRYETAGPCRHGFPTLTEGGACDATNRRGSSPATTTRAGELLQHLYDGLVTPTGDDRGRAARVRPGALCRARLARLDGGRRDSSSCRRTARPACPAASTSPSTAAARASAFSAGLSSREAGYNRWADANRIVVLYPQAEKSFFWPFNPRGCWDWWGYSGVDYATRNGAQLASVHRMLAALGAR